MIVLQILVAIIMSPLIALIGLGMLFGDLIGVSFHFIRTGKVSDYEPFWKILSL